MIFSCSGGRSGSFCSGRGYLCKGGGSGSSAIFPGSSASTSSNVSASCHSSSTGTAMGSGGSATGGGAIGISSSFGRQHFLYFLPLPQGQGSLRPTFIVLSFPHSPRAGNRNPWIFAQSRETACMLGRGQNRRLGLAADASGAAWGQYDQHRRNVQCPRHSNSHYGESRDDFLGAPASLPAAWHRGRIAGRDAGAPRTRAGRHNENCCPRHRQQRWTNLRLDPLWGFSATCLNPNEIVPSSPGPRAASYPGKMGPGIYPRGAWQ